MKRISRPGVIVLFLLIGPWAASAQAVVERNSVRPHHRHHACRANQHVADCGCLASPTQPPQDAATSPPTAVLVEAMIAELTLKKDSVYAGELATIVNGGPAEFVRRMERLCDVRVFTAPSLLVLDKQRAEMHAGGRLGYRDSVTQEERFVDIGTTLRMRPFVSPDGLIRLEAHLEHTTAFLDDQGVPHTRCVALTTNVLVADGATVVIDPSDVADDSQADEVTSLLPWVSRFTSDLRHNGDGEPTKRIIAIFTAYLYKPSAARAPLKPETYELLTVRKFQRAVTHGCFGLWTLVLGLWTLWRRPKTQDQRPKTQDLTRPFVMLKHNLPALRAELLSDVAAGGSLAVPRLPRNGRRFSYNAMSALSFREN